MDYREIVAVTGISGLYQLMASKGDGAIVRALADGKTVFVSARKHQVTPLESIEIYTTGDNVRLHEVLQKMKEAEDTHPLPEGKDPKTIKAYFEQVLPEYDEDRVYASDLKKMVKWYQLLKSADLLDFSRYQQADEDSTEDALANDAMPLEGQVQLAEDAKDKNGLQEAASQSVEGGDPDTAPAKKARTKKAAEASADTTEEAAPKKTARKKAASPATEEGSEDAPKKTARKKKTDD
ncbi:MAG: hypothetical protein EOP52_03650 [Sphingobacteriales bacterium]|nr:MAG: hypothetical protein EOP52_03650 [Sphingobacteriales bacterium]